MRLLPIRKKYIYEISNAGWGGHEVILHLTAGWEPFAISESFGNTIIWFKRRVEA